MKTRPQGRVSKPLFPEHAAALEEHRRKTFEAFGKEYWPINSEDVAEPKPKHD